MIAIAQYASWRCGKFIVRRVMRPDNPSWPSYWIFRKDKLVGRSFSVPDEGWCEAIERITKLGRYVDKLSDLKKVSFRLGRPTKAEQGRRAAELLSFAD